MFAEVVFIPGEFKIGGSFDTICRAFFLQANSESQRGKICTQGDMRTDESYICIEKNSGVIICEQKLGGNCFFVINFCFSD